MISFKHYIYTFITNHVFHQCSQLFFFSLVFSSHSNMSTRNTRKLRYVICKKRSGGAFLACATNFKTMVREITHRGMLRAWYGTIPFSEYFIDNCQYLGTGTDIRCANCNAIFGLVGIRHIFLQLDKIALLEVL